MKKITDIIVALPLAFLLLMSSCSKDDTQTSSSTDGILSLSYSLIQTRSDDSSASLLENSTLKIYKSNGDLIRYYKPATEAPDELYLVAGSYYATLSAGEAVYTTTDINSCIYYGKADFEIIANQSINVALNCSISNSAVKVVYDQTVASNFQEGYITYVTASDSFSKSDAEQDEEYTIAFTESGTGYFILPEGVSNLSWGFYGTHIDPDIADMSSTGVISNALGATLYTLTLKYSETPDGYIGLEVFVDTSADEYDDSFVFSPQPTIKTSEFEMTEIQNFSSSSYNFSVSSINTLNSIEVQALDSDDSAISSMYVLVDGSSVDLSSQGLSYTATDKLNGQLTINPIYFDQFTTGGVKSINIIAKDELSSKGDATPQFRVSGLITNPTVDLWNNSGEIEACVASDNTHEVVISYRKVGDENWTATTAQMYETGMYKASIAPNWTKATNSGSLTTYELATGFTAGNSYEYKYSVDGVEQTGTLGFTTSGTQSIPYFDMEDDGLSCWTSSNSSTSSWGSGNNTFASSLCKQSTYSGMGGSYCAKLAGASVSLVDIAAGNLFLGQFERPSLTSGTVYFGQSFDWTSRPTSFKFKYAASIGTVDAKYHSGAPLSKGDTDIARVFFAIVDWSGRHEVTSGTSSPTGVWDPETMTSVDKGNIIGYASQYITASTTGDMVESELTVYYYDTETKPSGDISIVVSCATSAYGDYMTGSTSSVLYVDDFELGY